MAKVFIVYYEDSDGDEEISNVFTDRTRAIGYCVENNSPSNENYFIKEFIADMGDDTSHVEDENDLVLRYGHRYSTLEGYNSILEKIEAEKVRSAKKRAEMEKAQALKVRTAEFNDLLLSVDRPFWKKRDKLDSGVRREKNAVQKQFQADIADIRAAANKVHAEVVARGEVAAQELTDEHLAARAEAVEAAGMTKFAAKLEAEALAKKKADDKSWAESKRRMDEEFNARHNR